MDIMDIMGSYRQESPRPQSGPVMTKGVPLAMRDLVDPHDGNSLSSFLHPAGASLVPSEAGQRGSTPITKGIPLSSRAGDNSHQEVRIGVSKAPSTSGNRGIPLSLRSGNESYRVQAPWESEARRPSDSQAQVTRMVTSPDSSPSVSEVDSRKTDQIDDTEAQTQIPKAASHLTDSESSKVGRLGSNGSSTEKAGTSTRTKPLKRIKTYTQDSPSRYCHLCSRKPEGDALICANFTERKCLKIVCKKCFDKNKWSWAEAREAEKMKSWTCCHCRGRCPQRASCSSYEHTNNVRRERKLSERRGIFGQRG